MVQINERETAKQISIFVPISPTKPNWHTEKKIFNNNCSCGANLTKIVYLMVVESGVVKSSVAVCISSTYTSLKLNKWTFIHFNKSKIGIQVTVKICMQKLVFLAYKNLFIKDREIKERLITI